MSAFWPHPENHREAPRVQPPLPIPAFTVLVRAWQAGIRCPPGGRDDHLSLGMNVRWCDCVRSTRERMSRFPGFRIWFKPGIMRLSVSQVKLWSVPFSSSLVSVHRQRRPDIIRPSLVLIPSTCNLNIGNNKTQFKLPSGFKRTIRSTTVV